MNNYSCLAIHDISGLGKCSLTVALPILSCSGVETTVLPTAVFSNHTAFPKYDYEDLTDKMLSFSSIWSELGASFGGIYSGFLGSEKQIAIVSEIFDMFKTDENIIVVDPVMGDGGKIYKTYTKEMADGMLELAKKADYITPNMTEACYMTGTEYIEGPYTEDFIEGIINKLVDLGCKNIVLTGVSFNKDSLGVATYSEKTKETSYYTRDKYPGYYHGTGDIFGSILTGAIIKGRDLQEAVKIAADFVFEAVKLTAESGDKVIFGVKFESLLPKLGEILK